MDLQRTAAKYEGITDTVGLYKFGEIAAELGTTAVTLNASFRDHHVQLQPKAPDMATLFTEYIKSK
jgi:phage antirepressor YoqD-like protein